MLSEMESGGTIQMKPTKTSHPIENTPVFIISSYNYKNGILRFVQEQVASYVENGFPVNTVSLTPSETCNFSFNLGSLCGAFRWFLLAAKPKKALVVLHFYNGIIFRKNPKLGRLSTLALYILQILALAALGRMSSDSMVYFHELETNSELGWKRKWIINFSLKPFKMLVFYNNAFRLAVTSAYADLSGRPFRIEDHSLHMTRLFTGSQNAARESLRVPAESVIFLCLGFIVRSKGFDCAIEAFCKANRQDAYLYIVGSAGTDDDANAFCGLLQTMAAGNSRVRIINQFVDDVAFDAWLQAADVVILPYRSISSSSVGARATVYRKTLFISNLPSLSDMFPQAKVSKEPEDLAILISEYMDMKFQNDEK